MTALLTALCSLSIIVACGEDADPEDPSRTGGPAPVEESPQSEDPARPTLDVVVNIFPLRWLAEEIGGDLVNVRMLEAEPHKEPTTGLPQPDLDLIAAADANLFALNLSAALQAALDKWRADRGADTAIFDIAELRALDLKPGPADLKDDLLEGGLDPHFWLDPRNRMPVAADWVTNQLISAVTIDDDLKQDIDDLRPKIEARGNDVKSRLDELDRELANPILKDCAGRTIVPEHPAFMYFAETYGMTQFPVTSMLRGELPPEVTAARRGQLDELFQREPRPAFFYAIDKDRIDPERNELTMLATDHRVTVGNLDSLEQEPALRNEDEKIRDYIEAMKVNARNVAAEFGCAG